MKTLATYCLRTICVASVVAAAACSSEKADFVSPPLAHVSGAVSGIAVSSIDGVYGAGCTGHAANEAWSVGTSTQAVLAHEILRVRPGDTGCSLSLTAMHDATKEYAASPAIVLAGQYGQASAFNDDAQTGIDFYGNAKLTDPTFSGSFGIELTVSEPTNDVIGAGIGGGGDGGNGGSSGGAGGGGIGYPDGYEEAFTATQDSVGAPNFGLSAANGVVLTDRNNVVTTASGTIQLVYNGRGAQAYAVVHGSLANGMSPADLATAMQSAPHGGVLASPYTIPMSDLDLVGADLTSTVSRSIIVRNTDNGLSSYQVLRIRYGTRPLWTAGAWGTCSATCGGGTQTRSVSCLQNGSPSTDCLGSAPSSTQACNTDACGTWVSDAWGACSAECGGGTQTRVNRCQINGSDVDPSLCPTTPPETSQSCNEEACEVEETGGDVGAFAGRGSCGTLGLLGPGFTLTAGPTTPLPVGTTMTITGSGVANIGVFSVSGGTANVAVLSGTSRQITLTAELPAGATIAFRTTLSISVAFQLNSVVSLPSGYTGTGAKTAANVSSTLILCSAN